MPCSTASVASDLTTVTLAQVSTMLVLTLHRSRSCLVVSLPRECQACNRRVGPCSSTLSARFHKVCVFIVAVSSSGADMRLCQWSRPHPLHAALLAVVLLLSYPICRCIDPSPSADAEAPGTSLVILRAELHMQPDGGGLMHIAWVLTSDTTVYSDPSWIACPMFHWDGAAINGPDSFPNTHCGAMFATVLPLPALALTAAAHTLRLTIADAHHSIGVYTLASCSDSVVFRLISPPASPSVAADDFHLPGGEFE